MQFDPNKVSAVVFDWGGVFCNPAEPFASVALQTTLGMDPEEITAQIPDLYEDHYRGKYSTQMFWCKVMEHFNLTETADINPDALSRAYIQSYRVRPEMVSVARKLKERYFLGLISNLSPVMRDHIRQMHHTQEIFDVETYSCDLAVAAIKPAEVIYNKFLTTAHKTPQECLFIDDSKQNIEAAERLGFQTLLFTTSTQFFQDIRTLVER